MRRERIRKRTTWIYALSLHPELLDIPVASSKGLGQQHLQCHVISQKKLSGKAEKREKNLINKEVIPLPHFAIHISKLMAESQKTLVFSKGEFLCE